MASASEYFSVPIIVKKRETMQNLFKIVDPFLCAMVAHPMLKLRKSAEASQLLGHRCYQHLKFSSIYQETTMKSRTFLLILKSPRVLYVEATNRV